MAQANDGYIPPSIQREMDQHMRQMPANLQKYQSGGSYIPNSAAKSMNSYMQKNMPAHLKQYIPQYMEQKTVSGLNSLDPGTSRVVHDRPPAPNPMRRDHSAYGEQFNVNVSLDNKPGTHRSLSFSPQYSGNQTAPPAPPPAPLPNGNQSPYDFIMNSGQPKKSFGTGSSMTQRIIIVAVGAMVLLIGVIVVFALISKGGTSANAQLLDLAEQQTEIARVADIGVQQATSTTTKNFAHTTKLSMLSSQQQMVALLARHHEKVKTSQLSLKQNSSTDQQLTTAASNNAFDSTFTKLLTDELNSYRQSLLSTYRATTSADERALLQDDFNGASILVGSTGN